LNVHPLGKRAFRAFKGPVFMAVLIGWLGAGKKHWQATYRTSPFGERWRWIECLGLEHGHPPSCCRRERDWSLCHRRLQTVLSRWCDNVRPAWTRVQ